jgi:hypothetical protein
MPGSTLEVHMNDQNAAHSGNENTGTTQHHKDAVAAPKRDLERAAGVDGSASAAIPFNRGTTDIVIRLKDGQDRYFDADEAGRILASTFLTAYGKQAYSVHFGESCHYIKNGVFSAAVHMTREEFFEAVQP